MTNSTTPAPGRPAIWQTEPCPPWCERWMHTDNQHPDDRCHYGPERQVTLRHEKALEYADQWDLDYLKAFLCAEHTSSTTRIELCRNDLAGTTLALDEAELLAVHLLSLVRIAREAGSGEKADAMTADVDQLASIAERLDPGRFNELLSFVQEQLDEQRRDRDGSA